MQLYIIGFESVDYLPLMMTRNMGHHPGSHTTCAAGHGTLILTTAGVTAPLTLSSTPWSVEVFQRMRLVVARPGTISGLNFSFTGKNS